MQKLAIARRRTLSIMAATFAIISMEAVELEHGQIGFWVTRSLLDHEQIGITESELIHL